MALPASFDDLEVIANDTGFQKRCNRALQVASVAVMSEDPGTSNHNQRVSYARTVISGSLGLLEIAQLTLTNASIASEANVAVTPDFSIPDADIQFAINSLFNVLAGIGS